MNHAIEIRGLEKRFERFQLGPLDLTVPTGAIYGLIGPNGAGKTTTIDLIFGLGQPDAGTIAVLGLDHQREEIAMKRQTGYAGPELHFNAWGRVGKALRFVSGFYQTWDQAYAEKLLADFRLSKEDKVATLSFGARTKLALVSALAWQPRVLVLDEPFTGLDPESKQILFTELLAIVQDEQRTVLISSHNLADLERYADHLGVIHQGKLLAEGTTDAFLGRWRKVELEASSTTPQDLDGLLAERRNGQRMQAVLDKSSVSESALAEAGWCVLGESPLTLEEIFLALTKQAS